MAPSTRGVPPAVARSATTSGVPPSRAMRSTTRVRSSGMRPPCCVTQRPIASTAPFRISRPCRFTPLIRVMALNGTNSASLCPRSSKTRPSSASVRPRSPKRCLASTTMLRPSGVSSGSEASCARSASSCSVVPVTGISSDA